MRKSTMKKQKAKAKLTRNSMNASFCLFDPGPPGAAPGSRNCRLNSPPSSMRRLVLDELDSARAARAMYAVW